jgi:hypothetical protein
MEGKLHSRRGSLDTPWAEVAPLGTGLALLAVGMLLGMLSVGASDGSIPQFTSTQS